MLKTTTQEINISKAVKLPEEIGVGYSKPLLDDGNFMTKCVKIQEKEIQLLKKFYVNGEPQNCAVCDQSINDQFLMSVENKFYHSNCLKCTKCDMLMDQAGVCFSKHDSLYCKMCYQQ